MRCLAVLEPDLARGTPRGIHTAGAVGDTEIVMIGTERRPGTEKGTIGMGRVTTDTAGETTDTATERTDIETDETAAATGIKRMGTETNTEIDRRDTRTGTGTEIDTPGISKATGTAKRDEMTEILGILLYRGHQSHLH